MGKARGGERLPWISRLPKAWARELAARYFSGTFPMYDGVRGKDGHGEILAIVESAEERMAREKLAQMHEARMVSKGNVQIIMEALRVLRVRGDYARGLRKGRRTALHEEDC